MLVPQVPQMWHKCGTKKGPHTFLDDLGIMHFEANTLASEASKLEEGVRSKEQGVRSKE